MAALPQIFKPTFLVVCIKIFGCETLVEYWQHFEYRESDLFRSPVFSDHVFGEAA